MNASRAGIGIICPGFTPPTKAELVKFRGNTDQQREEGLVRATMINLGAVPTDRLLKRDEKTVIMAMALRPKTEPTTLRRAVKRFTSAGWYCEVVEDCSSGKPRPAVQFYGGQGAIQPLELDFGFAPPSPQELADFRKNPTDPWLRVEGVLLALWQMLAYHGKFKAAIRLEDRLNKGCSRKVKPDFAAVVQAVQERFERRGWWCGYSSGWIHVQERGTVASD